MRYMLAAILAAAMFCGCGKSDPPRSDAAPRVVAGVAPVGYLTRRIAGEHVDVDVLMGQGVDPHLFDPTPRQVVGLSRAQLLLTVGLPIERSLAEKLCGDAPGLTIVDLSAGLDLLETSDHDPNHETDPHVWMSPRLAAAMAQGICDALSKIDPDHALAFEQNLDALLADLDRLHAHLTDTLADLRGRTLLVYHPAFGYFAREYGLVQKAVETGGKTPGPRHIARLLELARAEDIRVIFVQPQFSQAAADSLAAQIGGAVVPLDPLATDYMTNMTALADTVQRALTRTVTQP